MKMVFVILFISCWISSAKAQTKRALIIAISNYTYWPKLSSANDVGFIVGTLRKQGFTKENISTLTDKNATHAGITQALNTLIAESKPGDIILIHFSSHGEQIEDDNGDETDGLDETVVTVNAELPDNEGHFKNFQQAQQDFFRDDEFGMLIDKLRSRIGKTGDLIVFMDLCHSGTGSRDNTIVRGNKPAGVSSSFDPTKYARVDSSEFSEPASARGVDASLAPYVIISASRAEEVDAEILNNDDNRHINMGSLSYAVSKVFENLDSGITYQSLFSKIQIVLDDRVQGQHPVMEGNGVNRLLFGGKSVYQKPYIELDNISASGTDIRVTAGVLSGLDTGAQISVYPAGTLDPARAKALATGMVIESHSYTADITLNKKLLSNQPVSYWAFLDKPVYNTKPISIHILSKGNSVQSGFTEEEIKTIHEALKDLPLFTFTGDADLILAKGPDKDSLILASNGYSFELISSISGGMENLKETLQRYARYRFLKTLEIKDADIRMQVRLVPVIDGKADTTKINSKIRNGVYEYQVGDKMVVWVKNTGRMPFYFNILDLQPDGKINPVLPNREKKIYADDLKINGGSSYLFDKFIISITPPYGQEVFKIFASTDKIDLEDIAVSGGKGTRGSLFPLERLVGNSYDAASRGTETNYISDADGLMYNILFSINARP